MVNMYSMFISQCVCIVDAFSDKDDKKSDAEQDEAAIAEARREAEERRKEKHRKMEDEREKMRQDIRDKVVFSVLMCDCLKKVILNWQILYVYIFIGYDHNIAVILSTTCSCMS